MSYRHGHHNNKKVMIMLASCIMNIKYTFVVKGFIVLKKNKKNQTVFTIKDKASHFLTMKSLRENILFILLNMPPQQFPLIFGPFSVLYSMYFVWVFC